MMMQLPISVQFSTNGIEIAAPQPIPMSQMILGKTVEEVATAMPRLVQRCGVAHEVALREALGMRSAIGGHARLLHDVLLEHLTRFYVHLPQFVDLKPQALPTGWERNPQALRPILFGKDGRLPNSRAELKRWLAKGEGLAPLIVAIAARFLPGEATTHALPPPTLDSLFEPMPIENSLAARHASHPLMRDVEVFHGRGPLWRVLARLLDIEACLMGTLPKIHIPSPGRALVAAARGTYAVTARATAGIVTAFERVTPTDHMLAEGGTLKTSLANLPPDRHREVPLVMTLLDPCVPVKVHAPQAV